jgi:mono/diheme cytochrome c family protein
MTRPVSPTGAEPDSLFHVERVSARRCLAPQPANPPSGADAKSRHFVYSWTMTRSGPGRTRLRGVAAVLVVGAVATVSTQAGAQPTRGELLYSTHCIACHTTQVHWRDQRLAKDWASLTQQVGRWAKNAGLSWSREEIVDVSRYLNALFYHFEVTTLTERREFAPAARIARAD